jgi:hypothetical protein
MRHNKKTILLITVRCTGTRVMPKFTNWPFKSNVMRALKSISDLEIIIVAEEKKFTPSRHFHIVVRTKQTGFKESKDDKEIPIYVSLFLSKLMLLAFIFCK